MRAYGSGDSSPLSPLPLGLSFRYSLRAALMYVIDSSDAGWCGDLPNAGPAAFALALALALAPAESAERAPEVAGRRPRDDAVEGANPLNPLAPSPLA